MPRLSVLTSVSCRRRRHIAMGWCRTDCCWDFCDSSLHYGGIDMVAASSHSRRHYPSGREFKRAAEYVAYRRGIWLLVVSGEIDARRLGRLPAMVQSNSAKRTAADCRRVDKAHSSPIWWPSQRGATGAAPARYSSNAPQVQIQFTCGRCWFSSTRRCSASRRAIDRRPYEPNGRPHQSVVFDAASPRSIAASLPS